MVVLEKIKEGQTEVYVYKGDKISSELPVFYNPIMKFNRNISVACISVFQKNFKKEITICDALSASGIAGIRYLKEIKGVKEIWLNDKNPNAIELIKKNLSLHNIYLTEIEKNVWESSKFPKIIVTKKDANVLLSENVFTVVDIDPFGSPAPFLDSAFRSCYWKGFLCITATDTAPLCGTYPKACFRKYGIKSFRCDFEKELGARILVSSIILTGTKYEKAFIPVFTVYYKHFFRVFGKLSPKESEISKLLDKFNYISYCAHCGRRYLEIKTHCKCGKKTQITGALYTGELWDKKFVEELKNELEERGFNEEKTIVEKILEEIELQREFYYNTHFLSKITKKAPPSLDKLISTLNSLGYKASRTHFDAKGIRTNAEYELLIKSF